ncbi:MAG: hypothetical protein ABI416_14340 [Ginsengibacter sp.]
MPRICNAQDRLLENFLLKRIACQQVREDPYFFKGIYPSYFSKHDCFSTKKRDNNIFFNSLIAYTLNEIKTFVGKEDSLLIMAMMNNARSVYSKFKNKKRDTYNFWRTDSAFDFPFPTVFNLFSKNVTLPDDLDCTVLSLLALDSNDSTAKAVHTLMQRFTNTRTKRVRSVIKAYDTLNAYSTWFGIKFPVVFDVSVLCNILTFVQAYNLPWTKADSASLEVIVKTIQNNYHINKAVYASPVYPKTSVILYHIARLMKIKKIPSLENLKVKLVTDAANELTHTDNFIEKIVLSNAIFKWGYKPPELDIPAPHEIKKTIEQNNFSFFIANLPSYFKDFLKLVATNEHLGFYNYYCPAYNDALLLEYLVLSRKLPVRATTPVHIIRSYERP